MKSTQNLPTKLKELRKQNHYSQEYVAEQLNISRQAISHWENGRAYPDIDNLVLLAELYGVSVDELLEDSLVECAMNSKPYVTNNSTILEMLGFAVIVILSVDIPFFGIFVPIVIALWLKRTERKYYIIYLICVICFFMGIQEIIALYAHIGSYGEPYIMPYK